MKKIITFGIGIALLASPIVASANVTDASNASTIASLTALIQVLTEELQQLIAARSHGGSTVQVQTPVVTPVTNQDQSMQVNSQDIIVGTGAPAVPGSVVSVLYTGKLQDGTVFDSSAAHGNAPLTFTVGAQGLIPGFQIGVNGMKLGGERLLTIPSVLGYGATDVKDSTGKVIIPANSTIIFDVRLINVNSTSVATNSNPTSNSGAITVSTSVQPSNTLAPQGAIVPFTSVTLTNTGSVPVTVDNLTFQRNGATDAVFQGFTLTDELGVVTPLSIASVYGSYQNHLAQFAAPITIAAGQSKTLTLNGKIASNLSSYNSQTVKLLIVGFDNTNVTYTTMGSGQLPIVGAMDTLSSTLNACYPPQTSVYGYQCW